MSLWPWGPACAPGLGLGSLRFLHLQLEFTELADVWMRFLGPQFIRSCSASAAPNLIFNEHFTSRVSHFSMQTLPSHNLTFSRYSGLFWPFFFIFLFLLYSAISTCVQKWRRSSQLPWLRLIQHLPSPLALPTPWIKQGFHAQPAGQSHPSLQAWRWCPVTFCWHYFTFWIQQQNLIFLCVCLSICQSAGCN